jgi:hypothetical protein
MADEVVDTVMPLPLADTGVLPLCVVVVGWVVVGCPVLGAEPPEEIAEPPGEEAADAAQPVAGTIRARASRVPRA